MRTKLFITTTMAAALTTAMTGAALAQSQGQSNDDWQYRQSPNQQNQQDQRSQQRPSDVDTTVIGYDLDADGQVDVFYRISQYELDEIRRRGQSRGAQSPAQPWDDRQTQRRQRPGQQTWDDRQQRPGQQQQPGWDQRRTQRDSQRPMWNGRQSMQQSRQPMDRQAMSVDDMPHKTVQGTVRQVRQFELAGADTERTFTRLETNDGKRVIVNLGPSEQLRNVNLRSGDEVAVRAKLGKVNNRMVLVADKLKVNDRIVDIQQPRIETLKRISGEVVGKRTESFRGASGENLMVRVRNDDGVTHIVCLGSTSGINANEIQKGDEISVLAKPVTVNDRPVYMAKRVSVDGRPMSVQPLRTASRSEVRPHLRRTSR